jgi:hypothetical protein
MNFPSFNDSQIFPENVLQTKNSGHIMSCTQYGFRWRKQHDISINHCYIEFQLNISLSHLVNTFDFPL